MKREDRHLRPIKDLFAQYRQNLRAPQKTVILTFIDVVEDVVGVRMEQGSVKYSVYKKTLTVQASGVLRSEILMKQEDILLHVKGRLGTKDCPKQIL